MSESSTVSRPDYLSSLNDAQREAATFGVAPDALAGPLLVIAGAGTGKTNTLAHRVAHLLVNGAQPESVMLLTFSRRAADEMTRRVQRIVAQVSPRFATLASAGFPWSGTFHGVGARLLREYAGRIGLDPAFTIHDREDSADLMNLVRHDIGLSSKAKRFPLKGTCLAIYSAAVNTQSPLADVLQSSFPWCAEWEADLKTLFRAYVEAKQAQQVLDYDDLLLYWAEMMGDAAIAADVGARFDHVLVDEYQDTNRLQAAILLDIGLNLEIKPCPGRDEQTAGIALSMALSLWPADRPPPLVSSFSVTALEMAQQVAPHWPRGYLMDEPPDDWAAIADRLDVRTININAARQTAESIAAYRATGRPVLAYTVNEAAQARTLFAWGVSGIFTDTPQGLFQALTGKAPKG